MLPPPLQRRRPRLLLLLPLFFVVVSLSFPMVCQSWVALPSSISISTLTKTTTTTTTNKNRQWQEKHETNRKQKNVIIERYAQIDKGFNLLEIASNVVPQGRIVQTAKESWKFAWKRMMTELAPQDKTGNYQRPKYSFGGTLGSQQFPIEAGRYHVYVGNPCPWCHRVRLVSNVLGLESKTNEHDQPLLEMTILKDDPIKASRGGWVLEEPILSKDVTGSSGGTTTTTTIKDLRELYDYLSPNYQGRCTAPLLVDWKTKRIVSNESKDIVRMLPLLLSAASTTTSTSSTIDLCPAELVTKIDETNDWIYTLINNGVYRCGFSTSQEAYQKATMDVMEGLKRCEEMLQTNKYLCGEQFTESDIMLLPTMLRFDGVYSPLFGAGGGKHVRLQCDYPAIFDWLSQRCWKDIDGVSTSIDISDACASYYKQLFPLNPGGIIPYPPITAKSLRLE